MLTAISTPIPRTARQATLLALLALLAMTATAATAARQPWLKVEAEPGIQVVVERIEAEVNGPFAEKHLTLSIRNRSTVALEATLQMPLAANERLRGYALDVDGRLRDAVAVDRVQARVAFEETQRKRVDPALVEQDVGNSYRLRVFPVPAGGERRVRLDVAALAPRAACGWQHRIEGGGARAAAQVPLIVTLAGSAKPKSGGLSWHAVSPGQFRADTLLSGGASTASFCLPAPRELSSYQAAQAEQQFLFAELPVQSALRPRALPASVELVWDASLSMAGRNFERERQLLSDYFSGRNVQLLLSVLREGKPAQKRFEIRNGDIAALLAALMAEPADGASDLAGWQPDAAAAEVLLFSDAARTWPGAAALQPAMPVYVIDSTGRLDPAAAAFLSRAGGAVIALDQLDAAAARQLLMTQGPRLLSEVGPLETAWQMPSAGPLDGALRACRITPAAEDAVMTVRDAQGGQRKWPVSAAKAQAAPAAAFWCATWLADALAMDADRYRTRLSRLGRELGLVTGESSLLVLESIDDYVRHGILPPASEPALRAEAEQRIALALASKARTQTSHLAQLRKAWAARKVWWAREFPKDKQPAPPVMAAAPAPMPMPTGMAPPPPAPMAVAAASVADRRAAEASSKMTGRNQPAAPATITLMALRPNEPYSARLLEAKTAAELYRSYLDLRADYLQSPAFYLDVADRLYELGDATTAARVLSNIVELLPRQQAALRIVAYRLQQAGQLAQTLPLLERVRGLAPDEPQSWRDLGLAYGRLGQCQPAIDALSHVVLTPWSSRFADIDLIALAELNDQSSRCAANLAAIDPELLAVLPVGLRAVLSWDLNDTDIDLWVTDPNGEAVYYAHPDSYQGGHLSRDFTAGYGPEEFVLRAPKPGRYKVEVNYFGSRVAKLSRGAVVQVQLQTGFGSAALRSESLVLRLAEKSGRVFVGNFDVAADGAMTVAP